MLGLVFDYHESAFTTSVVIANFLRFTGDELTVQVECIPVIQVFRIECSSLQAYNDVILQYIHSYFFIWYQASLGAPDTSVEFQLVNSRICVAMMVFAPIYVAQIISSVSV